MKMMNNVGARIVPWGTPLSTFEKNCCPLSPNSLIICFLPESHCITHFTTSRWIHSFIFSWQRQTLANELWSNKIFESQFYVHRFDGNNLHMLLNIVVQHFWQEKHVSNIVKQANPLLSLLKHLSKFDCLKMHSFQVYLLYARLLLERTCPVWYSHL